MLEPCSRAQRLPVSAPQLIQISRRVRRCA